MSARSSEPNVAELQHAAQAARRQLLSSLARLDERVKHMAVTAGHATAAGGWGMAAACALWVSLALDGPRAPALPPAHRRRRGLAGVVLKSALKTAGFVATSVFVYACYRRARRFLPAGAASVPRLPAGERAVAVESTPAEAQLEA